MPNYTLSDAATRRSGYAIIVGSVGTRLVAKGIRSCT